MAYATATYYDCNDNAESLYHTDEGSALVDWIESRGEGEQGADESDDAWMRRIVEREAPVTVCAYRRMTPSKPFLDRRIEDLMESIQEDWAEDYGDPNAYDTEGGPDLTIEEVAQIAAILTAAWVRTEPWKCEAVGQCTYNAEEVLAILFGGSRD